MEYIENGKIEPSFVVTHKIRIDDAPRAYEMFKDHDDGCVKVVPHP